MICLPSRGLAELRRAAAAVAPGGGAAEVIVSGAGVLHGLLLTEHQGPGQALLHDDGVTFVVASDGGQHHYGWDEVERFSVDEDGDLILEMGRPSRHMIQVLSEHVDSFAAELSERGIDEEEG